MDNRISNNVNFRALHLAPKSTMVKCLGRKYPKFEKVIPNLEEMAKDCDIYVKPERYMFELTNFLEIKVSRQVKTAKDFFKNFIRDINIFDNTGMRVIYPKRCKNGFSQEILDVVPVLKEEMLK